MSKLIFTVSLSITLWGSAFAGEPKPLTHAAKKICSSASPCQIEQRKTGPIEISFSKSARDGFIWLNSIVFKNISTKKVQTISTSSFQGASENDIYGVFALDLNEDGFTDLAIESDNSARLGPLYHYFIFNPKTNRFSKSKASAPMLKATKNGRYRSEVSSSSYVIDHKYVLKRTKRKKKK